VIVFRRDDEKSIGAFGYLAVAWILAFRIVAIAFEMELRRVYEDDFYIGLPSGKIRDIARRVDRLPLHTRSTRQHGNHELVIHASIITGHTIQMQVIPLYAGKSENRLKNPVLRATLKPIRKEKYNVAAPLPLEVNLQELFVKKAPPLPEGGKRFIVTWAPWISLLIGFLSLISALTLWHWAHDFTAITQYANEICATYRGADCHVGGSRLSFWVWIALLEMLVEAVLYLLATRGLRERRKQGWNYLYYGALVNLAYAIVSLFTSYNAFGNFVGALIGSAIGFYILFQIRDRYTEAPEFAEVTGPEIAELPAKPAASKATKATKAKPAARKPKAKQPKAATKKPQPRKRKK
jgi:hypothetical protein